MHIWMHLQADCQDGIGPAASAGSLVELVRVDEVFFDDRL